MNTPKMNLNPEAKGKKQLSPEEYQAQFFADLGNALLNMANYLGRISENISELRKDFSSHAVDISDLLELKKLELEKVHDISPDLFPQDEEGEEEGGESEPK